MLSIGGSGTVFKQADGQSTPILVFQELSISSGLQELTLGKEDGQPTLYALKALEPTMSPTARISPASNTKLLVLGVAYAQYLPSGSSRDFNIEPEDGLLIIAF